MPPSTLVDVSYISLSSSRSNSDGNSARPRTVLTRSAKSTSRQHNFLGPKYESFFRIAAFIVLEFGFIALTSLAIAKPIPLALSSNTTLAEVKGGVTIISVIWHALAVIIVKDILLRIFSAEWEAQYRKSGKVIPGVTDIVSRMTAGFITQLQHFALKKATLPYRLAFISMTLLMLTNGLGPSAITISPASLERPISIQVANLTLTKNLQGILDFIQRKGSSASSEEFLSLLVVDRANLITRLEQLEDTSYGFGMQGKGNTLIPWPASNLISTNEFIKYQSEIIIYDFRCSWMQPSMRSATDWTIGNKNWMIYNHEPDLPGELGDPTILPMRRQDGDPHGDADSSLVAFLFLGRNSTPSTFLDLEGLPTTFISSLPNGTDIGPTLATALRCDPHFLISPATVTLSQGNLSALPQTGPPKTKNITPASTNVIFSQSLLDATSVLEPYGWLTFVNAIAQILFLTGSILDAGGLDAMKPLPLDQINTNMNSVVRSTAKAYLSGFRPNGDNITSRSFKMVPTDGTVTKDTLALVGSMPFLSALIVVVALLVLLLIALLVLVRFNELQTFYLENVAKMLHVQ